MVLLTPICFSVKMAENLPSISIPLNPCPAESGYIYPAFANSVDPDQLASEEAN